MASFSSSFLRTSSRAFVPSEAQTAAQCPVRKAPLRALGPPKGISSKHPPSLTTTLSESLSSDQTDSVSNLSLPGVSQDELDIFRSLLSSESASLADPAYCARCEGVTPHAVHVVVDWMHEVCLELHLNTAVFFLSCNLFHRFLSRRPTRQGRLQLVAVASLLVAAKMELPRPPGVETLSYVTGASVTPAQIVATEAILLAALDWAVNAVTPYAFVRFFARAAGIAAKGVAHALYLCELTLRDPAFLCFRPSQIAASAVAFAAGTDSLPPAVARAIGCSAAALRECRTELLAHWRACTGGCKSTSFAKYATKRLFGVSVLPPPHPGGRA